MDFLKNLPEITPLRVIQLAGIIIIGLMVLIFAIGMVKATIDSFSTTGIRGVATNSVAPGIGGGMMYEGDYATDEMMGMPALSTRNVSGTMLPPLPQSPTGDDAEDFEVTQYNATIETRDLDRTCDSISALKAKDYVIFENTDNSDRNCNFTFKVRHENVDEVLGTLKGLNPKELSENTYTIKRQIDDFTSEEEVLKKKRASIDETLESALNAYGEITKLATNTQNADALAKIITSKIQIIERLTQEKISINEQLDRLSRAKTDQLDRLEYTYFSVYVYENKFVDGKDLYDSWKAAIKSTVQDLNKVLQAITINLILIFFIVIQWALYALIALFVAKYGWKIGKYIWNK